MSPTALPKILIVDDKPANLTALKALLENLEAIIIEAGSGNEALSLTLEHEFAVVLMDVQMPEMDGYEAMEKIRGQDRFRELPIIALTTKAMKGDRIKCIRAGASDYLAKPVDSDKLLSMMRVWLYRD